MAMENQVKILTAIVKYNKFPPKVDHSITWCTTWLSKLLGHKLIGWGMELRAKGVKLKENL